MDECRIWQSSLGGVDEIKRLVITWATFVMKIVGADAIVVNWIDARIPTTIVGDTTACGGADSVKLSIGTVGDVAVCKTGETVHIQTIQTFVDAFLFDMQDRIGDTGMSCVAFCDDSWKILWAAQQFVRVTCIGVDDHLFTPTGPVLDKSLRIGSRKYAIRFGTVFNVPGVHTVYVCAVSGINEDYDEDDDTMTQSDDNVTSMVLGGVLGRGGFGSVFRGVWKNTPVAVKVIGNAQEQLPKEIEIGKTLNHQNVIKIIAWAIRPRVRELWIVLELCVNGSLADMIKKQNSPPLHRMVKIFTEIAKGMSYIHSQGLIHGDLSANNILFDATHTAKISDFGMIRQYTAGQTVITSTYGTLAYTAPERLKTGEIRASSDVYAFGVIVWELVTGRRAWSDMQHVQIMVNKLQDPLLILSRGDVSCFQPMIDSCMDTNQSKRPTFETLIDMLQKEPFTSA